MDVEVDGVTYITPNRRSLAGVTSAMRRISKTIDPYDVTLLLASVRNIVDNHPPVRAVEIAVVLGSRMLMDEICRNYGMTYEFPDRVHRTVKGKKKAVVLPALKTIVLPPMYRVSH